ncbi:MAG: hypothetical protein HY260_07605, partial [Chloroflexi bacterium]|nr:hypothetical protein [Chloroflexota bacterium]
MDKSRLIRIGLTASLLVFLGLHAVTLTTYPPIHCDEAYYADTALSAVTWGAFATTAQGPVYGIDRNHTIMSRVYSVGLGLALKTLGVSIVTGRLFSLLGTLAAMAGTVWLGKRIYGWRTGLWAALLFGFSWKAFIGTHTTRPDTWLTAAIVALIAILVAESSRKKFRHALLIGIAGPLVGDLHFNGMYFLVGITLAVGYLWFVAERHWDLLLGYGAGVTIGVVLWAGLRFLPDPAAAWYQWRVGMTRLSMGWGTRAISLRLMDMVFWVRDQFWSGNRGLDAVEGLFFLGGLAFALKRRSRADVTLLIVIAGAGLAFAALMT